MSGSDVEPDTDSRVALRPPEQVMDLARLGSFHQTRLSFMRALLRRVKDEGWQYERPLFSIDDRGTGTAVYRVFTGERHYSLVCFAHDLPDAQRSDRVIAEAWDATFVLFDGIANQADIERLAANAPRQEAGRYLETDLVLSRANRSVRLFDHVVERLANGEQPDEAMIREVGYLMRTTAVYGNGKFGLADRDRIAGRGEFRCAFRVEMLAVWLIRAFTTDLVEALARSRSPHGAARLDPKLRRKLGVGNATGLGMAPFLVRHPALLDRWIGARETALARVRNLAAASETRVRCFHDALNDFAGTLEYWVTVDPLQHKRLEVLAGELPGLRSAASECFAGPRPWNALYGWAETHTSLECQELTVSLLLEPHGETVDDLAETMEMDEETVIAIDGRMTAGALGAIIEQYYRWALAGDYRDPAGTARFWYVSEEKLEPRLGERAAEPGAELELPLAIGRDMHALFHCLEDVPESTPVARVLLDHPEFRHAARRAQYIATHPYSEIRNNLIDAALRPIDMLRCKLSFFGASRFDPRSDRWVRITMYQGAPFPDEIHAVEADRWAFSPLGRTP